MRSSISSKVSGPSCSSITRFPLDTSAAAMRHKPRAKDGPRVTGAARDATGFGCADTAVGSVRMRAVRNVSVNFTAMLAIDLTGRRALVAGVADDAGFGFAIAKALGEAGANVCVGTWPPALKIFQNLLERGKMDDSRKLSNGKVLEFEKIYPLDAAFDTLDEMPEDVRTNKRYADVGDPTVAGLADRLRADCGDQPRDILVHSLANGPELKKPLLETSRRGYLEAVSVSAYSLVSMIARFGPLMRPGSAVVSLTYMASERVIPGYGGGMSS